MPNNADKVCPIPDRVVGDDAAKQRPTKSPSCWPIKDKLDKIMQLIETMKHNLNDQQIEAGSDSANTWHIGILCSTPTPLNILWRLRFADVGTIISAGKAPAGRVDENYEACQLAIASGTHVWDRLRVQVEEDIECAGVTSVRIARAMANFRVH